MVAYDEIPAYFKKNQANISEHLTNAKEDLISNIV